MLLIVLGSSLHVFMPVHMSDPDWLSKCEYQLNLKSLESRKDF